MRERARDAGERSARVGGTMTSPGQVVRCVIVVLHHAQADGTASQRAGPAAGDADSTDEHQGRAKDVVGCGKTEVR